MADGTTINEETATRVRGASRWRDPATSLLAAAVLLPLVLFALAAWKSYGETLRQAQARVDRTARVLEEHALKVFETHRLVIQEINTRIRFVDWAREADRYDLHLLLKQLQDDLQQVATITVMDSAGRMLESGRIYPADPRVSFADRDYFQALAATAASQPVISRAYAGRTSGIAVFNLAARLKTKPGSAFEGVIAVSVDRAYFETFYQTVEPTLDHSVDLVRSDGEILARFPPTNLQQLKPDSRFLHLLRQQPIASFTHVSTIDGVERLFAYRKVGMYPVFVRFGLSVDAALAPWRDTVLLYGIVAALASFALLGVSLLALRQTDRERLARRRWQETAAALQTEAAERGKVEEQLRQSQKMEALGRLTGGVAHDFNNLLTAVIGNLDLVRRRGSHIGDRERDLVGNALEGAMRAANLIGRLLAFARQQPLQPTSLDANRLVAGMADLLQRSLGEMIRVNIVLGAELWPVKADPNQLESAILNLAVNARDAMPTGGQLTITTANDRIEPGQLAEGRELAPGDYVTLSVADVGTGIPPELVSSIFEPFFTTKPIGKGTGLGLSQVYGFAKQSGGHVAVRSTVGEGSIFTLYLPRAASAEAAMPAAIAEPSANDPQAAEGTTIVVVEDESIVRRLTVSALEEAGYRVLAAADGPSGLALLRRETSTAMLLTDVVLGGSMNGRMLADMIQRERPDLPVLFTTGYTHDAIFHDGQIDEGIALIAKPFTSRDLLQKVEDVLRGSAGKVAAQ